MTLTQMPATAALKEFASTVSEDASVTYTVEDEETLAESEETATGADFADAVTVMEKWNCEAPDPADGYGVWIPGIPVLHLRMYFLQQVYLTDGFMV